ncbi:MAG: acetyl-CoA C-acyltransferase [Promethearchaeota archaeon]
MEAKEVYLCDFIRTPFSRAHPHPDDFSRDVFSKRQGLEFGALLLKDMFDNRLPNKGSSLKRENVSEVLVACAQQQHENSTYGGRIPIWMALFPVDIPATVLDMHAGSGLAAMEMGFGNIVMGYSDVVPVLGFEHSSRVPMHSYGGTVTVFDIPPKKLVLDPDNKWYSDDVYDWNTCWSNIQIAQKMAEEEANSFKKEDTDKFAVRSHNLAEKALNAGWFKDEILPVMGHKEGEEDSPLQIEEDQSIVKGANLKATASLPSVSTPGWDGGYHNSVLTKEEYISKFGTEKGIITPGNSSPANAGGSLVLLMSKNAMEKYNVQAMAKILSFGYAGTEDPTSGKSAVPSALKALKHAGLKVEDINFWEIDEGFGIVPLHAINELKIKDWDEKVNIKGGSIAIGEPMGATGPRIVGNLARILKEKKAKYGLAVITCGGGQGIAVVIENMNS